MSNLSKGKNKESGNKSNLNQKPDPKKENLRAAVFFGVVAAVIWGAFPVITRLGVEKTLSIYDITAIRFSITGLILLPLLLRKRFKGISFPGVVLLVCGAGAPYIMLAAGGLSFAPAAHFGVIAPSSMLLGSTLLSRIFLGDTMTWTRLLGLGTIVLGILVIGWEGLTQSGAGSDVWKGDLIFVAAGLSWSIYTVTARRFAIAPGHSIAIVSVISMVFFVPGYIIFKGDSLFKAPLEEILIQALYQGVFSGVLALLFYTRTVAILGAARGAVFAALVPGFALLMAVPILGEIPTFFQWMGVAVVTLGMVLALGLIQTYREKSVSPDSSI